MLGAFLSIAAIVFFVLAHEAGHFFAAKATGMKVTEFFFGFGPKIWSFRKILSGKDPVDAMETLLQHILTTRTNREFLERIPELVESPSTMKREA